MSDFLEQIKDLSPKRLALLADELQSRLNAIEQASTEAIAVIGMGCRFPGGVTDPESYWHLLKTGTYPITLVPPERWDGDEFYDPDPNAAGKTYTRWGGFLDGVDQFDPDFFGMSPREALSLDPQQRLLLEVSWEALERAGQSPQQWVGSRTGVYVAIGTADYANLQTRAADLTDIDAYTGMGSGFCFAAGRLSYVLGLQGPNLALDAACASSLMAVHLACQSLRQRECEMALAGGVNLILSPETNIAFSKTRMMAADGRCKTFDAAADGYVRSEGCGVVVLKRLSDAIAHRDPILALIRGSAISHGGASGGLTIPNGAAQQSTIRAALAQAKVEPAQIQYVEAQGTGTSLGDTIEVRALSAVFQQGRSHHEPLWLASVKTNIGHTETASGMASLIKVILALQHQALPPHLHLQQLNPEISLEEIPAKIPTRLTPWTTDAATRLAGINAFGMSGTNAHAVVEAAPHRPLPANTPERPLHILTLSAKTPRALRDLVGRVESALEQTSADRLADVCFTAGAGRSHFEHRLAVVGATPTEMRQQLAACRATPLPPEPIGTVGRSLHPPKIVFVFTPSPRTKHAGRQLYATQPTFRQAIDRCVAQLQPEVARREPQLRQKTYLPNHSSRNSFEHLRADSSDHSSSNSLKDSSDYPLSCLPEKTAAFVLSYALATLWQSWGIVPDGVMGVGVGEGVAACVAGVISLEAALHWVAQSDRGDQGNGRSPSLRSVQPLEPAPMATCTVLCAQTGQALSSSEVLNRLPHACETVEPFAITRHGLPALSTQGYTHFLNLASQPLADPPEIGVWLSSLDPHRSDWEVLLMSLGQLYQQGAMVDWDGFDHDYVRHRMPLPTYPFQRQRYWKSAAERGRKAAIAPIPAHPPHQSRLTQAALLSLPVEDRLPRLVADLCDRLAQLLAIDPAHMTPHRPLNTLALDSLMAIELKLDLETRLGSPVALTELLESDSITTLATRILATLETAPELVLSAALPQVIPAPSDRHQPFPLNDIQEAYWIGRNGLFDIGNVAAHVYAEFDTDGLDCDRLSRAFRRLIDRHDILRTILSETGEQQILAEVPPYDIAVFDLRHQPKEQVTAELAALRQRLSHHMHNPYQWALFEVCAARLDDRRLRLFLSFDNLLVDAASLSVLCREWGQLYQDLDTPLVPLDLSFRDYVLALKQFETSELYQRSLHYWQDRLPTFPLAPNLPLAVAPSTLKQPQFVRQTTTLPPETWQQLKTRAAQQGLTPSGLLVAAYAEVLAAWSTRRFSLNLTTFNRLPIHPQVQQIVGDFTSLTLLAVDYSEQGCEDPRFAHRARQLQQQLWQDLEHSYVSGVRVLRELARVQERSPGVTLPVVFTSLLANPQMKTDSAFSAGWLGERVYSIAQTPQVWLDHQVYEDAGALVLNWDAVEGLFPTGLIEAMFAAYGRLLHALAWYEEPWQQRSLLLADQTLQDSLNATEAPVSEALLHTLVMEQAQAQPHHPAVVTVDTTLSYEDLLSRAQQLAHRLRQLGAQPNQLVAIAMEKGWEQVVAVLAVLMSGAAYVPIDPGLPEARRGQLLHQGEVRIVLTQPHLQDTVLPTATLQTPIHVIGVEPWPTVPSPPLEPVQGPTDLAYVIYTSGSTGVPKGVMIDHRGAVNTLLDINRRFGVNSGDRVLALSSLSFDLSVYDLLGTLAAGGTIVMPPAIATKDPAVWADLLKRHQVTIWNSVPALLQMLVTQVEDLPEAIPESLRLVLLSGDWLPLSLPDRLRAIAPQAQVVSLGGATEASIWSILYPIGDVDPAWKSIPYGRPMTNQRFYVLDERLEPCPVWTPGQLYIGGIGLAQGYWHDPAKTAASFILHPRTGERLYRTGDLGRYLPIGQIEFLGREDHQVKIGGYRIELGEIETILEQHPEIHQAAVLTVGEPTQSQRLIAFVVPDESQAAEVFSVLKDAAGAIGREQAVTSGVTSAVTSAMTSAGDAKTPSATEADLTAGFQSQVLHADLAQKLPEYMLPDAYVPLKALPLTANGKVDRRLLQRHWQAVQPVHSPSKSAYVEPRNALEMAIATLWQEVLKCDRVGIYDNFFERGGDSLLATQVITRIRQMFVVEVPLRNLFQSPTVAALAEAIAEALAAQVDPELLAALAPPHSEPLQAIDPVTPGEN
ncbi:amino acid adenylation domain-containing protein [Leptolyngbya sp. AN02str]|uniref:hybrid non-ribosomal peptide synthetase/type I polyketide synthase n=1 Tax=Leptolyngbya sp. AN02str TaxID=3423363 RepID=UPI003D31E26B